MATLHTRAAARVMLTPSVVLLAASMLIPLGMTVYFSTWRYNLLMPGQENWVGFENYRYFLTDPAFLDAIWNTFQLVGGILVITIVGGTLLALLFDQPFWGRGIVRLLVIAPFFVMPTVSALVWKNMLMHPVNGLFAWVANGVGLEPIDWFAEAPMFALGWFSQKQLVRGPTFGAVK